MIRLLAFIVVTIFSAPSAWALSCVEPSLARDISGADIVFEGRVVKIERDPDIRHDDTGSHLERVTYYVSKGVKGAKDGETVTAINEVWMPLSDNARNWSEQQGDTKSGLAALKLADKRALGLPSSGDPVYFVGMCDTLIYEASPENVKQLQKLEPAAR